MAGLRVQQLISIESQPQNPEFRNNPENFQLIRVGYSIQL